MPIKDLYQDMPLGKLFSMITKPYFGALVLELEEVGVEKNFSVLILIEQKQNCTQQFISDSLQIDKVSMVKIIDGFSKKQLVKRIQNPKDRREYFIELTDKGRKLMPKIHNAIQELNNIAFKGFSEKERIFFTKAMITMYHNIEHFPSSHVIVYKTKKKSKA